jgi:hypothetical protein
LPHKAKNLHRVGGESKVFRICGQYSGRLCPHAYSQDAEYVGAFTYRFASVENLVNTLFDMGPKSVYDQEKTAICVVKS